MLKFSEILEFFKKKFRKIPILKEFEWFEWFEWFEMVRMVRSLADRTFQLCAEPARPRVLRHHRLQDVPLEDRRVVAEAHRLCFF